MRFFKRSKGESKSLADREYLALIQAPPPAPIALAWFELADGTLYFPLFTDTDALLRFRPQGGETASAPLSALRNFMTESPIDVLIINPGSPDARILKAADLVES